jgi:AraC-like DNA-binding protein
MSREYTILVKSVNKIIDAVKSEGIRPKELYRAVNFDPALIDDPDNRIPFSQLVAFYEHGARLTGDDAFGLHIGERAEPELFDVLGYVVIHSPTFGEAINRLIRYHSIWSDGAFYNLDIKGPRARLTYEYAAGLTGVRRHDSEMTLSILVSFARRGTGVDWTPQEVSFQHSKPESISEHQRIFRSRIHFDRPINELVFDSSLLALAMMKADPGLCVILDRHAQELLSRRPRAGGFINQVRQLLGQALKVGDEPRIETISQKLGISVRTLQRKLKEENTSHQDLLDELRSDLSKRYLQEPQLAICEVAYLLGFSEPSAFHRAFRRWTGVTPKEFRRGQVS